VTPDALQSELAQPGYWDGFWTLLADDGTHLRFSTYWGGEAAHHCSALLSDGQEIALLSFAMLDGDPDAVLTLFDASSVPVAESLEVRYSLEDCYVVISFTEGGELHVEDLRVVRRAGANTDDLSDQIVLGPDGLVFSDPLGCAGEIAYDVYVQSWDSQTPWRTVSVESHPECCQTIRLSAIPNPFSASVQLRLPAGVSSERTVSIDLYDVRGRNVRSWTAWPSNASAIEWDGHDRDGRLAPAGVYFFRVDDGSRVVTEKIVKLR
jgi:hypothetical protein